MVQRKLFNKLITYTLNHVISDSLFKMQGNIQHCIAAVFSLSTRYKMTQALLKHMVRKTNNHGRRKRGVCRGSDTPNYLCGGDIDMYIPQEKPNTYPCKLYATRRPTEMLGKAI